MTVSIALTNVSMKVGNVSVLRNVDLSARAGETVAIVGQSGSGKSTLLSLLGLLDRPDEGSYSINGTETTRLVYSAHEELRGQLVGFVFQRFALLAHLSALENVMMPLRHMQKRLQMSAGTMRDLASAELIRVGLEDKQGRYPRQLSGGEQQRVAIARAVVHTPQLVLADEPTGSLDPQTGRVVVKMLAERARATNSCMIVVTHDQQVASSMDRVLQLEGGQLRAST